MYVCSERRHRNAFGATRQTDEDNDTFLSDLLRYVDERAYDELATDHPALPDEAASVLLTDRFTPIPAMDMLSHESGVYQMDDLSLNLMPRFVRFTGNVTSTVVFLHTYRPT